MVLFTIHFVRPIGLALRLHSMSNVYVSSSADFSVVTDTVCLVDG